MFPILSTIRTTAAVLLPAVAAVTLVAAQVGGVVQMSNTEARSRALEMYRRKVSQDKAHPKDRAIVERRQREFTTALRDFAAAWNTLIEKSTKGAWNVKQAKAVRKAFDKLVHSEGWVEDRGAEEAPREAGAGMTATTNTPPSTPESRAR